MALRAWGSALASAWDLVTQPPPRRGERWPRSAVLRWRIQRVMPGSPPHRPSQRVYRCDSCGAPNGQGAYTRDALQFRTRSRAAILDRRVIGLRPNRTIPGPAFEPPLLPTDWGRTHWCSLNDKCQGGSVEVPLRRAHYSLRERRSSHDRDRNEGDLVSLSSIAGGSSLIGKDNRAGAWQ
jgi:hypothetical protein